MTTERHTRGSPRAPRATLARLRAVLEVAALVMIIAVSAAMLLAIAKGFRRAAPAPAPAPVAARAARAARPPDPPLPAAPVSLDGAQLAGNALATVVAIEYSDFQCPFCGQFARTTWPSLKRAYIDTGKVRFAFRQFPLPMHANALVPPKRPSAWRRREGSGRCTT
jgi:protein-disulfide isomerase